MPVLWKKASFFPYCLPSTQGVYPHTREDTKTQRAHGLEMVETKENSFLVTPRQGSGLSARLTKGCTRPSEYLRPFHLARPPNWSILQSTVHNHLNNVFSSAALHPASSDGTAMSASKEEQPPEGGRGKGALGPSSWRSRVAEPLQTA